MWEHNNDIHNAYGTPMALMLLPYWDESHPSMDRGVLRIVDHYTVPLSQPGRNEPEPFTSLFGISIIRR